MTERATWKERLIDVSTLDTPLRRVIAVGYAVLVALALSAAARDYLPGPPMAAEPGVEIPLSVVAIAAFSTTVALCFLLAGASQWQTRWRLLLVIPIALFAAGLDFASASVFLKFMPSFAATFLALGTALVIAAPRLGWKRSLVAGTVLCLATLAIIVAITVQVRPSYGPTYLFLVLGVSAFALMPALLVVGWDFAEIAQDLAPALLARTAKLRAGSQVVARVALDACGAVSAAVLYSRLTEPRPELLAAQAIVLLVAIVLLAWAMHRAHANSTAEFQGIGYWAVFAVAVVLTIGQFVGDLGWKSTADPRAYNFEGPHRFSLLLPEQWHLSGKIDVPPELSKSGQMPMKQWFSPVDEPMPRFAVAAAPRRGFGYTADWPRDVNDIEGAERLTPMPFAFSAPDADGWQHGEADAQTKKGTNFHAFYWKKEVQTNNRMTNADWYLVCVVPSARLAGDIKICEQVRRSFRFYQRTVPSKAAQFGFGVGLWIVLGAVALLLVRKWRRRQPLLEFLTLVSAVVAVRNLAVLVFDIEETLTDAGLAANVLFEALILSIAACVILQILAWRRPVHRWLTARAAAESFLVSMILITVGFVLYVFASAGSEHSRAIQGFVICAALTWELATSGHSTTNHGTPRFPRAACVLVFSGYLLLVASCAFFFVKLPWAYLGTSIAAMPIEPVVAVGIVCLGVPFVLLRHLYELWRVREVESVRSGSE